MLGSHLSIAGGLHKALLEAQRLGMPCVQIFTKNQRQWRVPPLQDSELALWREQRQATGIQAVVSHASYLINLASPPAASGLSGDPEPCNRDRSLALFQDELARCAALDIPYLVIHPGAHMGQGREAGLALVAQALNETHRQLPSLPTLTCLEITAGQGTCLGSSFEELAAIRSQVLEPQRVAYCIDTAHLLAAGYDLTSATGMEQVLGAMDKVLGLDLVKVVHVNDSKSARGSHLDRHEHIGRGQVSLEAFRVLVNHHLLGQRPLILETPKETDPKGRNWDEINIEALEKLLVKSKSAPRGSKR